MPTNDDGGSGETIGLWVVVPVAIHEAAEAFAKCYAEEGAEEICAAVLHDLAELRAGRRAQRLRWVWGWVIGVGGPRGGGAGTEGA